MGTHKANLNFYLYTGFDETASDGFQALEHLNESGIQYTHMHYFNAAQMVEVRNWAEQNFANTEYEVVSPQFPFIVYEKAFDIRDTPPRQQVLVHGIDNILATLWATLESFEG